MLRVIVVDLAFFGSPRNRALELKKEGVDAEKAGGLADRRVQDQEPDLPNTTVTNFVKSIYAE